MPKDKPEIRFAGYTDAWEKRQLGDLFNYERPDKYIVDSDNYDTSGIPVLTANKSFILGYTHETNLYDKGDSIIFDDFTLDNKYVDFPYKVKSSAIKILTQTKGTSLRFAYELLNRTHIEQEGHARHYISIVQPKNVLVPQLSEQIKIAQLFKSMDKLITVNQRKVDLLKELKKGFLQKMFPKNGEDKPEIRFGGYTDAWEKRRLGDIMDVTSVKRIHQSDWTTTGVPFYRARDLVSLSKNAPIAEPIFIDKDTYEDYSKKSGKVKSNELLVTGVGTLGVAYLVPNDEPRYFKDGNVIWFRNNTLNGNFLYYSFMTTHVQKFIKLSAGTGTVGTYTIESGKKTTIGVPIKYEQQKIGGLFQKLDQLITVNQRRVDLLKQEKKALLQKMFV